MYLLKRKGDLVFTDIEQLYEGLLILPFKGFDAVGKSKNEFTQEHTLSDKVDYIMIGDKVFRTLPDVVLNFMFTDVDMHGNVFDIDVWEQFCRFRDDLMNHGTFMLRTMYLKLDAEFWANEGCEPSETTLHRPKGCNHITASMPLKRMNIDKVLA